MAWVDPANDLFGLVFTQSRGGKNPTQAFPGRCTAEPNTAGQPDADARDFHRALFHRRAWVQEEILFRNQDLAHAGNRQLPGDADLDRRVGEGDRNQSRAPSRRSGNISCAVRDQGDRSKNF
jgi:hypothetical protein